MRVLLIEDDAMLGRALCQSLRDAGMAVDWVQNGRDGDLAIVDDGYSIVLLDLNLPDKAGLDLLRHQRARGLKTPVLILTARDGMADRIMGLDLGADDYLVKPFAIPELFARMRAVTRRHYGHAVSTLSNGVLALDLSSHEARSDGIVVVLPTREFALLQALLERPGTILSRAQLEDKIYGWGEEVESNAVEALIYSVRKKLGKHLIRNLRGAGWMVDRRTHEIAAP